MAEKKNGLSVGMIVGSIAIGAAAGVFYHFKRAEIIKLAEDIIARVKRAEEADAADDEPGDRDTGSAAEPEDAEAVDVNIVDSGVSLESVETENEPETVEETAEEAGAEKPEAEAEPEAADEDEEDDIERPKKPWFWSK